MKFLKSLFINSIKFLYQGLITFFAIELISLNSGKLYRSSILVLSLYKFVAMYLNNSKNLTKTALKPFLKVPKYKVDISSLYSLYIYSDMLLFIKS